MRDKIILALGALLAAILAAVVLHGVVLLFGFLLLAWLVCRLFAKAFRLARIRVPVLLVSRQAIPARRTDARAPSLGPLQLVHDALVLSRHALTEYPAELPAQLRGRLHQPEQPLVKRLLRDIDRHTDWTWLRPMQPALFAAGGPLMAALVGHWGAITGVALALEGRVVASAGSDGYLRVWDVRTGRSRSLKAGEEGWTTAISCIAFHPDGQLLISATGSSVCWLQVWDLAHETSRLLERSLVATTCLAIDPSRQLLVAGRADGTLRMWNLARAEVDVFEGHRGPVTCLALDVTRQLLVSGSQDGTLRVWGLERERGVSRLLRGHRDAVTCLALDTTRQIAVSGSMDKTVRLWDLARLCPRECVRVACALTCLAIDPVRQLMVSGSSGEFSLRVWNLADLGSYALEGHANEVTCVALESTTGRVVSGSRDTTLRVWDLARAESEVPMRHSGLTHIAAADNRGVLVSASADRTLRFWDLARHTSHGLEPEHGGPISCLALDAQRQILVSATRNGEVNVWDLAHGTVRMCVGHDDAITCLALDAEARRLVTGSRDATLRVWDLAQGTGILREYACHEVCVLRGHTGDVTCLALDRDRQLMVSGSDDETLRVWDLVRGTSRVFMGHRHGVTCLALDSERQIVVAGSQDGLRAWDIAEGTSRILGQSHSVDWLALDRKGQAVVWSDGSGGLGAYGLYVYELTTERSRRLWESSGVEITCAALDRARRLVVFGTGDGALRVWNLGTGDVANYSNDAATPFVALAVQDGLCIAGDVFGRIHLLRVT